MRSQPGMPSSSATNQSRIGAWRSGHTMDGGDQPVAHLHHSPRRCGRQGWRFIHQTDNPEVPANKQTSREQQGQDPPADQEGLSHRSLRPGGGSTAASREAGGRPSCRLRPCRAKGPAKAMNAKRRSLKARHLMLASSAELPASTTAEPGAQEN